MRSAPFIRPLRGRTTCEAGQVGASLADTASRPRAETAELVVARAIAVERLGGIDPLGGHAQTAGQRHPVDLRVA